MARSMFSIHEQRLASGWSHRRGGGFAERALRILIHEHSSPPHPPSVLYLTTPRTAKKQVQTTLITADKT